MWHVTAAAEPVERDSKRYRPSIDLPFLLFCGSEAELK